MTMLTAHTHRHVRCQRAHTHTHHKTWQQAEWTEKRIGSHSVEKVRKELVSCETERMEKGNIRWGGKASVQS